MSEDHTIKLHFAQIFSEKFIEKDRTSKTITVKTNDVKLNWF